MIDPWGEPPARKIAQAIEILHGGGVAAYPTDSVYALGCATEAKGAIGRIYRMKKMPASHRLGLICPDLSTAAGYGMFSQTAFRLAQRIFPGPYTLVVPATRDTPRPLTDGKRRTVGLRITQHPIAQALTEALGRPLLTSSAINPETGEVCRDADEILEAFDGQIDLVIDTEMTAAEPSTVIEVEGETITIIREGRGSLAGIV